MLGLKLFAYKTIDNDMELQENISSIAPAEGLAPLGASSSAGSMMPKFSYHFNCYSMITSTVHLNNNNCDTNDNSNYD